MTPNQITAIRVLLGFAAVALFGRNKYASLLAVGLTISAICLDAVDGYVARQRRLASPLGAQLDILGDRVIENLFFTYFAVCGLISLWVPVLFFVRGSLTDFVRSLAARAGRSGFGANSMLQSRWNRAVVASRASRAAYGALKCACFGYLGLQLAMARSASPLVAQILVNFTVAFCVVRGLPVLWEGRQYLATLNRARPAPAGAVSR